MSNSHSPMTNPVEMSGSKAVSRPLTSGGLARVAVVIGMLAGQVALAQFSYFGTNKVQTRDYSFQNLATEHFKILFYPGGETMAEFCAEVAEEYYRRYEQELGFGLDYKVPLLLYLSPAQFSETNVITDVIGEGVGGFAELFKNRIVIPFDGSYSNLRHVVGHELIHLFEFQMFYRSKLSALLGAVGEFEIPLWVLEGFAEFQTGWAAIRSEVFMRDVVLNGRLVPMDQLSDGMGYLVYREGQSFFEFVAEKYGRNKVYEFLHALKNKRSMEGSLAAVFGKDIRGLSDEWERWLRLKYWPQVVKLNGFDTLCRRLTDHRKDGSVYNTAPQISPSGTKIVMVSDRLEYSDCYVISALDGRVIKRLVKGERSGGFETMHLLRPGVAWSPDEKSVALVTQSNGRDNIALIDYATGRVRRRLSFGLDAMYTPAFSPDGKKLAFVGLKNGFSDVYVVGVDGKGLERITYDMYDDRDPTFSPGGDTIAFVSDRPETGEEWKPGEYAVWFRDGSGYARSITDRYAEAGYPVFAHSGGFLLYVAADSAKNVYCYSLDEHRVVRRTDLLGEVSHLSLSRDDRKLVFSYFENVGLDVALMLDPLERIPRCSIPDYHFAPDSFSFAREGLDRECIKPVGFSLSLDYAAGAASYGVGAYGGLAGEVNVAFSDILGNHRFALYTDLYGDVLNSDLVLQYWLLPYRVDYGFTGFQFLDIPYYSPSDVVFRVNRGGQALAGYPLNRFARLEAGLTGYHSQVEQDTWANGLQGPGWYVSRTWSERVFFGSGAFVFDNTFWDAYGPARGTRTRLGADATFLSDRRFQDVFVDFRNYQRLGRRFVLAANLFGISGFGPDADQYYIGGVRFLEYAPSQLVVRGYNPGEFYRDYGTSAGMASFELRYPFIDRLKLAFPLPLEIGGIRGNAFLDAGVIIRDGMEIWDGSNNRLKDLKLGAGVGLRFRISLFSIKLDFGKPLSATDDKSWKFIFGLGTDF